MKILKIKQLSIIGFSWMISNRIRSLTGQIESSELGFLMFEENTWNYVRFVNHFNPYELIKKYELLCNSRDGAFVSDETMRIKGEFINAIIISKSNTYWTL